jgi:uncharacterized damage-inducible protein DinB
MPPMQRVAEFQDQVARIAAGDPWYGPPASRVLQGVTASQAVAYPIPGAHSIWELVLHMTSWVREVTRRVAEGVWGQPADGDWPAVPQATPEHWRAAVAAFDQAHADLRTALEAFPETRLDVLLGTERDPAMATGQTHAQMLHGILQHDAYHLGQISLLRKLLA